MTQRKPGRDFLECGWRKNEITFNLGHFWLREAESLTNSTRFAVG
jgi:hypothetical protein